MKLYLLIPCMLGFFGNSFAGETDVSGIINGVTTGLDTVIQRAIVQLKQEDPNGEPAKRLAQLDAVSKNRVEELNSMIKQRTKHVAAACLFCSSTSTMFCMCTQSSTCCWIPLAVAVVSGRYTFGDDALRERDDAVFLSAQKQLQDLLKASRRPSFTQAPDAPVASQTLEPLLDHKSSSFIRRRSTTTHALPSDSGSPFGRSRANQSYDFSSRQQ